MSRAKITDGLRQKKNGVWERAEVINGKRRWFSSLDPEEVWRKRNAALGEAEDAAAEEDLGPLFETVSDAYQEQVEKMKYGTRRSYLPAIKRARSHFEGKRMREVEPYMISEFLKSMAGMAHTTVSNQKTILNGIFQLWIDSPEWRGDRNPAKMTSIPKGLKHGKRPPPTDEQVQIVKNHHLDPDALPAVVYLCTGERRGEACAIQLQDIDFKKKVISISRAIEFQHNRPHITETKTEAGVRKIPLLSMLEESLAPLKNMSPETYILSGSTRPLTGSEYSSKWIKFWRKYGVAKQVAETQKKYRHGKTFTYEVHRWRADVVAHQFRHEYVCMLCLADVPEEIAIQLVGHADARMIHEVYMSLKPQMIKLAGDRLNSFLAKGVD